MDKKIIGVTVGTPINPNMLSGGGAANLEECASAIKNTVSGKSITVNDVSPLAHKCFCKLTSNTYEEIKGVSNNICKFDSENTYFEAHDMPFTCEFNENGTMTVSGHSYWGNDDVFSDDVYFVFTFKGLANGQTYTFSLRAENGFGGVCEVQFLKNGEWINGDFFSDVGYYTFTVDDTFDEVQMKSSYLYASEEEPWENVVFYPQLESGYTATEWAEYGGSVIEVKPYIEDFTTVELLVDNGENVVGYTPSADGTVTDILSLSPIMNITTTDNDKVNIDFTYCVDTKAYVDSNSGGGSALGDIETALDNIIAIQETLIGGDSV